MRNLLILITLMLTGCVHFYAEKVMLKAGFTDKVYNESEAVTQPW
jgi:hypothetical protein